MLRKLLACLALLTGLTAAGAPAQAEVAHALASHIEASATGVAAARNQTAVAIALPAVGRPFAAASLAGPIPAQPAVSAVLLRSDRARE